MDRKIYFRHMRERISFIIFLFSLVLLIEFSGILYAQTVSFEKGKATILPQSYKALDELGKKLIEALQKKPDLKIEIVGHTDNTGSFEFNKKLSLERAKAVRDYLVKKFNLKPENFIIRGAGPSEPIAPNDTEEGRARNRRVEVIIGEEKIVLSAEPEKPEPVNPDAWIKWFKNDVKYQRRGEASWLNPYLNQDLYRLWKVNTLRDSLSVIKFRDGSTIDMLPNTLIIIYGNLGDERRRLKDNKHHVELSTGKLYNKLKSITPKDSFNVYTPSAELSIFSKENSIEVNQKGDTIVNVHDGYVLVSAQGKTVKVERGYGNITKKGEPPSAPILLPDAPSDFSPRGKIYLFRGELLAINWNEVTGVSRYYFQLTTDSTFESLDLFEETEKNGIQIAPNTLTAGQTYYYRVKAIADNGLESKFSDPQEFSFEYRPMTEISGVEDGSRIYVHENTFLIKGNTYGDYVFINGTEAKIDESKQFQYNYDLKEGENEIEVKTIAKRGAEETIKFTVVYVKKTELPEQPKEETPKKLIIVADEEEMNGESIIAVSGGYSYLVGSWGGEIKNGLLFPKLDISIYFPNFLFKPVVSFYLSHLKLGGRQGNFALGVIYEFLKSNFTPFVSASFTFSGWDQNLIEKLEKSNTIGLIPSAGFRYILLNKLVLRISSDFILNLNNLNSLLICFGVGYRLGMAEY